MKKQLILLALMLTTVSVSAREKKDVWPDGTKMDPWFSNVTKVNTDTLGKRYILTEHGVKSDSTIVQTQAIQAVIDKASKAGGGVIVVPEGTYLSGALFFKPEARPEVPGGRCNNCWRLSAGDPAEE